MLLEPAQLQLRQLLFIKCRRFQSKAGHNSDHLDIPKHAICGYIAMAALQATISIQSSQDQPRDVQASSTATGILLLLQLALLHISRHAC